MPDFRERVHRGETFVIAGERFGIGSSREMSPAGLESGCRRSRTRNGHRLLQQYGRYFSPECVQSWTYKCFNLRKL